MQEPICVEHIWSVIIFYFFYLKIIRFCTTLSKALVILRIFLNAGNYTDILFRKKRTFVSLSFIVCSRSCYTSAVIYREVMPEARTTGNELIGALHVDVYISLPITNCQMHATDLRCVAQYVIGQYFNVLKLYLTLHNALTKIWCARKGNYRSLHRCKKVRSGLRYIIPSGL
jgi:hypothetical protein